MTVRDDATRTFATYFLRLPERLVDEFEVLSPPLATGIAPAEGEPIAYVAQEHPEGRITFVQMDPESRSPTAHMLTGFELGTGE